METLSSIEALRRRVAQWRRRGERIALVPTMGNLHQGHLSLVGAAQQAAERVVVSIFVNPMQFGQNEDFSTYPRTIEEDTGKLSDFSVDLVFVPELGDIYPHPMAQAARVVVPGLSDILCGASRPGHFTGVATVVSILFHLVQPDTAVFGEKDYQQLLIIRRLAADLHMPVTVLGAPTVREPDGLAMSSRNRYLTPAERAAAPALYDSLRRARDMINDGDRDYGAVEARARQWLEAAGFAVDYVTVRRAADLREPAGADTELVILAAGVLGRARLIDNLALSLKERG